MVPQPRRQRNFSTKLVPLLASNNIVIRSSFYRKLSRRARPLRDSRLRRRRRDVAGRSPQPQLRSVSSIRWQHHRLFVLQRIHAAAV